MAAVDIRGRVGHGGKAIAICRGTVDVHGLCSGRACKAATVPKIPSGSPLVVRTLVRVGQLKRALPPLPQRHAPGAVLTPAHGGTSHLPGEPTDGHRLN